MPRIFVSLPIPASVGQNLAQLPMDPVPQWRWVKPNLYHITLAFIGDVNEPDVAAIEAAVSQTAAESKAPPFNLVAQQLGAFPDKRQARVLWAGVGGDTAALINWQGRLTRNLAQAGFATDRRRFIPHITLGRARRPTPFPVPWEAFVTETFGSWTANSIHIIESQLSPTGPRYIARHTISLSPAAT